ncbi:hypothetical protein CNMCM8694_002087 [Aspergillus lentulus]|nr:hypothetical protein CNMCM8060_002425 [Aspergillus lentulus]KAF4191282.1 hypothetical protein CNMCM8694_002087 [Aspergillus lentulus]
MESAALTFSSLHYNFTSLAKCEYFKNRRRVHGIRGAVANKVDPKASEATRGQTLNHQNHDIYLKYQSALKPLDVQALFYDLEPDYDAPHHLNAAGIAAFERDEEIVALNEEIAKLIKQIRGQPDSHKDLVKVRTGLYSKKAKRLEAKRAEFIMQWWDVSFNNYIAGNNIAERGTTCLFNVYKKYMPERSRIQETLFKEIKGFVRDGNP